MRISAIIPSYNRAHTIERALDSVVQQSSPVEEIILVDDGSSDDSVALVERRFPQISILKQSNLGVSAARNLGINAAKSNWIALLDSDDCWHPDKIEQIRAVQARNTGFVLYHSDEIWIRNGVRINPMRKHRKHGGWIFKHCLPLCAISPSTVVMHRDTVLGLGGFDETLPACEDYDLWLRLCHRYPVCFIAKFLVTRHAGHDDQLSQQFPAMDQYRIRSLDRLLREAELDPADRDAATETLLNKLDILLRGALKHGNFPLLEEFGPLRDAWRSQDKRVLPC